MCQMRILVADDDREISTLICTLLRGAGHQAFPAFDGASTMMAAMRAPQPNLIILDVRMPAGDGQNTRAEMMGKGAVAFMQKPFESEELLAAVAQLAPPAPAR